MNDMTYGFLKNLVQLFLPAFSTLYLSLAGLWHLPYAQQVVGTAAALATFLGVLLRVSTKAYNANDANYDGSMVVTTTEDGVQLYSLELNGDPGAMAEKKSVSFKVGNP
jgi:hypothetical protein